MQKKIFYLSITLLVSVLFLLAQVSCCFDLNFEKNSSITAVKTSSQDTVDNITEETIPELSTKLESPELYIISRLRVPGQAIDVKAYGGYAYLTNDLGFLFVIDVRDKESPQMVGKCGGIDSANIVVIQGEYAYISYTVWKAPESPSGDTLAESDQANAELYSICGFKIVDIGNKKDPKVVGDYISGNSERKSIQGLFIDGDYAYLNSTVMSLDNERSKLEIIDIKDKSNPKAAGYCDIEGQPNGLFVQGDYAYLNNTYYDYLKKDYIGQSKFFIVDITDRSDPQISGSCEVPANSWSVFASDNKAYLTSSTYDDRAKDYEDSIMQVVDISDPTGPTLEGTCKIPGGAWEIDKKDSFLLVSSNEGGISAIDVSDSTLPSVKSMLKTGGNSYDIAISGDFGYIADGFSGMVIIGLHKKGPGEGMIVEDTSPDGNYAPVANIDVYGDRLTGDIFIVDNPVFLSAIDSFDPDDDAMSFTWEVDGNKFLENFSGAAKAGLLYDDMGMEAVISEKGDEAVWFFNEPGDHIISVLVSDGISENKKDIEVTVGKQELVIDPIKQHTFDVEIECTLKNNSNILLKDLECYLRTPQSYFPYQQIISTSPSISKYDEVFDDSRNLLTHMTLGDSVTLGEGKAIKASITSKVSMYEYDFKKLETKDLDYEMGDRDLVDYTQEDIFIDSHSTTILNAVKKAAGNEIDPLKKAQKIYNYIARNIYYDFARAEEKNYEFMDSSEILKVGKGVCADYAILYTAMLRASGIPARIIAGIPVMLILGEKDQELDVGHAWVEVKLPGYGWIPVDITQEYGFMNSDYFLNLATEKGNSFLYENQTMDWSSYFFDGFRYGWDGLTAPGVEQSLVFRIKGINLQDINSIYS